MWGRGRGSASHALRAVFEVEDEIELREKLYGNDLEGTTVLDCYADWCGPCKVRRGAFCGRHEKNIVVLSHQCQNILFRR